MGKMKNTLQLTNFKEYCHQQYLKQDKAKTNIRQQTRRKYGPAPKGYLYHHIGTYHVDRWILVPKEMHASFHPKKG